MIQGCVWVCVCVCVCVGGWVAVCGEKGVSVYESGSVKTNILLCCMENKAKTEIKMYKLVLATRLSHAYLPTSQRSV
jgi:hypothetical protein